MRASIRLCVLMLVA